LFGRKNNNDNNNTSRKNISDANIKKDGQMGVDLPYSRSRAGHCLMDGVKFEFDDYYIIILSLYEKSDSERRQPL